MTNAEVRPTDTEILDWLEGAIFKRRVDNDYDLYSINFPVPTGFKGAGTIRDVITAAMKAESDGT